MTTAMHTPTITAASFPRPARSILRSTAVLLAALTLTTAVLVALGSVMNHWA